MSNIAEVSVREMFDTVSEVRIKAYLRWILGPYNQHLVTWGDVDAYLRETAQYMSPNVVRAILDLLRMEYVNYWN